MIPTTFKEDSQLSQSEYLSVTIEWPSFIRCGEVGVISLDIESGRLNTSGSYTLAGLENRGSQGMLDLSMSRNILAETRLDLANIQIDPSADASQPLLPGKNVTFWWNVTAKMAGRLEGTLWLHLRYIPVDGDQEARRSLLAYPIEINAIRLAGLSGVSGRWLGSFGVFLSALLSAASSSTWFGRILERRFGG